MRRIHLYFETRRPARATLRRAGLQIIRLRANVQFVGPAGNTTMAYSAVVDTGAPASIVPRGTWQDVDPRVLVEEVPIIGISKRKGCEIPASVGLIEGQLVDAFGNVSRVYAFPAFLAETDDVPLILGFADLLSKFDCHLNYEKGEAWVEEL